MNLKHFLSKLPIRRIPSWNYREICTTRYISPILYQPNARKNDSGIETCKTGITHSMFHRFVHSSQETVSADLEEEENDEVMNEYLSRYVWIMRGKLTEVYTDADKKEIDAMLRIIVEKVLSEMGQGRLEHDVESGSGLESHEFSEDLWKTVWEVSDIVIEDMKKAKKKEKMKSFLQCEEVKEMTRFAGEIGIRGDLLRELRFKWAREKLEDSEFYESLELMRKEAMESEVEDTHGHERSESNIVGQGDGGDQGISLPKRSEKMKYKIYGLNLSKPKWAEVAEQIHETGGSIWPQEPKPITGKCKIITEKILSLKVDDDPSPLIAEWIDLLQPSRVDWYGLLNRLKEHNHHVYFKVAQLLLDEESFQTDISDYSQLVDAHAKHEQFDHAERIIKKMNEKGLVPDILTKTTMVHMYSKAGNLNLAKEAFESLKSQGFQPDLKVSNSMIMAYINAGDPKAAEKLLNKNLKHSEDIYLAFLKSYAEDADPTGADKIANEMGLAGYKPSLKSLTYLIEAYSRKGFYDKARTFFDEIIKLGYKPDDNCIARMISAYASKNLLDKGLQLLLQLEKDGIEHGVATYAVLVDWLGKLQLIDEVEGLLGKFSEKGVSPSLDVHVSLCDMYARAREEKKALQALGVIEANKEKMGPEEFEKVINALIVGGFRHDAERLHNLMTARGFTASNQLNMTLQASQTFNLKTPMRR